MSKGLFLPSVERIATVITGHSGAMPKHLGPRHASVSRFLNTNLFDNLSSFANLEVRISALPGNKERGDAFEIFAEAYLATQKIALAQEVWPFEAIPLEQRQALSLDTGRDMGVDGT